MASDVTFNLDADQARAVQSFLKVVDAQKKSEGQFKKTTRAAREQDSRLSSLKTSALAAAGGFASLGAAITTVTAGLRKLRQEEAQAGRRITDAVSGRRALFQLASGPEQFQKLLAKAQGLRTDFGFNAKEAYKLTFAAKSAGISGQLDTLAQLKQLGFAPGSAIESRQKLASAFGGTGTGDQGAGNLRQIVNKSLAAARTSPVNAADIARVASTASVPFSAIGGGDEGLQAAIAVGARTFKSPEASAERLKSLSTQLQKKRDRIKFKGEELKGLELIFALDRLAKEGRLRSAGGERQSLQEFLGEANAISAARLYAKQQPEIEKVRADIRRAERQTGTEKGLLNQKLAMAAADPVSSSVKTSNVAEQQLKVKQERNLGVLNNLADAARSKISADRGRFGRLLFQSRFEALQFMFGDEALLRRLQERGYFEERPKFGKKVRRALFANELRQGEVQLGERVTRPGSSTTFRPFGDSVPLRIEGARAAQTEPVMSSPEDAREFRESGLSIEEFREQQRELIEKQQKAAENMNEAAERMNRAAERMERGGGRNRGTE